MKKILLILLLCTAVDARLESFLDQDLNLTALGIKQNVTYKQFMSGLEDLTAALETFIKEAKALEDSCPETISDEERDELIEKAEKINEKFKKKCKDFDKLTDGKVDGEKWVLATYIRHSLIHTPLSLVWKKQDDPVSKAPYEKDRVWVDDRAQSKINRARLEYLKLLQKSFVKMDKDFKNKNNYERKEEFKKLLKTLPAHGSKDGYAQRPYTERPFIY